jgi:putative NIF3 family GTP cyclohydrolase 1 type 2
LEAIDLNLDAFLTGETSHTMYAYCKEAGKTMISGGHYATEIFGVKEVAKELSAKFSLETTFIEFPTAL